MKKPSFFIAFLLLFNSPLFAQVSISNDNSAPDNSAIFDVKSANKGFLLPRITRAQRNAIVTPANGLMVFCTNCGTNGSLSIFTNGSWLTFSPCAIAPVAGSHMMSPGQIIWKWNVVPGATGYKWSATPYYETATDMGLGLSKTETGTICNITYTRFVWAYRSCGESGMTTLTQTIPPVPPASPTAGTHAVDLTNIVWNWNTVPGATGYKWNMFDDYTSAIEMGTTTTKTETGLTCGTAYTRYVWAYNGCGYSLVTILNQSTEPCLAIGRAYGGGIIFYLDSTGLHGLISATMNQYALGAWGCAGTTIGGTSTAFGTGQANTALIVNECITPGIAARICDDLVLNGFDDWFLPSKDELSQLLGQQNVIGGFCSFDYEGYWSSSECDDLASWYQGSWYQGYGCIAKGFPSIGVRPVRAF